MKAHIQKKVWKVVAVVLVLAVVALIL